MDVAVNSPLSGSESQHHSFDGVHLNNESTTQRRHIRYASPDASTPRRVNEHPGGNSARSSPNGESGYVAMNRTSPSISPFVIAQVLQEPQINGQNHDRMETDMESVGSVSDNQSVDVEAEPDGLAAVDEELLEDGEIMDTTLDSPTASDSHALDPDQPMETAVILPTPPPIQQPHILHPSSSEDPSNELSGGPMTAVIVPPGTDVPSTWNPSPFLPLAFVTQPSSGTTPTLAVQDANPPVDAAAPATQPLPGLVDPAAPGWDAAEPRGEWVGEREEESQDDDSTDEEDYPFWANLKEDTSSPDEEELRAIEETMDEASALDHEHWERMTYEALDDPEYIPGESGRIVWTVQGVNGTPDKPNKEKIMRSPSVLIGDHYWNIKYYPRGNDGTEQLSVYIECSTSPYEDRTSAEAAATNSTAKSGQKPDAVALSITAGNPPSNEPPVAAETGGASSDVPEQGLELLPPPPPPAVEDLMASSQTPVHWEVAAQVSCVVHNPAEPRVHVSQKSSHRYYHDNPDWGWTRFHGPWDEIHKRQRFQRQALLRNDTLTFSAYIRTIRDDTGMLWWHPPKEKPEWNSVARVGYRRLVCGYFNASSLIAAMSSWLFLTPIIDLVFLRTSELQKRPKDQKIRPLLRAIQKLVREGLGPIPKVCVPGESSDASVANVASVLEWYGESIVYAKKDVVATWETVRRILNLEISEMLKVADSNNFLRDIFMLKQSDIRKDQQGFGETPGSQAPQGIEPCSVLETVRMAFFSPKPETSLQGRNLSPHQDSISRYPSVLQIELQRQKYSYNARRWKKLTHHIKIDETLTIDMPFSDKKLEYTLYGMIVHSGDLESHDYYSVVRPGGPGSSWIKYASDRVRKGVTRLTTKQAITNHEGKGERSEGTAAVAYVVSYVRTDRLSEILASGPESVLATEPIPKKETDEKVTVNIYQSDIFQDHASRGIIDPRKPRSSPTLEFEFAASKTVRDLEKYVAEQYTRAGKQESFRLWVLDMDPHENTRGSPRFDSDMIVSFPLSSVAENFTGCHFWVHIIPTNELQELKQQIDSTAEPPAIPTPGDSAPVAESGSSSQNHPEAVIREQNGLISETANSDTETADQTNSQDDRTPNDEDTIMDEAHGLGREEPVPPVFAEPSLSWMSTMDRQLKIWMDRVYLFVKIFDPQNQTLRGVGSYLAKKDEKAGDFVRRVLVLGPDEAFNIYNEKLLRLKDKQRVKASASLTDSTIFFDGGILIAQRKLSESESEKLEAEGKPTNPVDFLTWLQRQGDPAYLQDNRLQSYFGSSYTLAAQKYGRPHGHGVQVTMPGDAYSGNFVAGIMSGHGTMAFANGDTYTGQWKSNEPNGQGKMVYAKTGNIYIGGFRKRKRHGKGTMQFEVADEEMQLCRICYEEEMDALFYDCGHVAACEGCAKQVDICPVCRKSVRAVVRIWRT